ncbi:response regulator [Sphingomonas canadensis]|uniref:Response regulator n=1 Tax=Sphingomonas canadensis TaxID=1219257 RepID=A0ABW3HA18_9SPHN|nr:response regulator [Sphingomonas canadensis]MCW3837940.1 response regulator [Sphingomonas canadensis]
MIFVRRKRRIERVLIVEDEPLSAFDTEHLLRDSGYSIAGTVDSVAGALALLSTDPGIDLVLADIGLADGSGIEVAHAARLRGIQVLFVTAHCPEEARPLAAGCLTKPYPQRALIAAVAAIDAVMDGDPPRRLPSGLRLFHEAA